MWKYTSMHECVANERAHEGGDISNFKRKLEAHKRIKDNVSIVSMLKVLSLCFPWGQGSCQSESDACAWNGRRRGEVRGFNSRPFNALWSNPQPRMALPCA